MKKVLSIVLALAMVFSCAAVAFAYDIQEGMVYFGPKEEQLKANPGDSVTFTIEFKALPTEDIVEAASTVPDGFIAIPFKITSVRPSEGQLNGIEITDAAKSAGAEIVVDPEWDVSDKNEISATVNVPAKYLVNKEAIDLFKLNINIDAGWPVKDNHAEYDLGFTVAAGDEYNGMPAFIYDANGEIVYEVYGIMSDSGSITAKPYEPNFFERVWEWIKDKILFLIQIDDTINELLKTEVFKHADWYSEYIANKDAEKAAK